MILEWEANLQTFIDLPDDFTFIKDERMEIILNCVVNNIFIAW